jgi:hypothetical protein
MGAGERAILEMTARCQGRRYHSFRMRAAGTVVRREWYRRLLHFWLEFDDRCTRCRLDDLVGADTFAALRTNDS